MIIALTSLIVIAIVETTRRLVGRHQMLCLIQESTGWKLNRSSETFNGRNFGVALAGLDPTDLGGVDAAAFGDLLLSELEPVAGSPQVGTEVAHPGIVCPGPANIHRGLHKSWDDLRSPRCRRDSRQLKGRSRSPRNGGPRPARPACALRSLVDHATHENRRHFPNLHRLSPPPVSLPSATRRERGNAKAKSSIAHLVSIKSSVLENSPYARSSLIV